jgi:hypothetical protein
VFRRAAVIANRETGSQRGGQRHDSTRQKRRSSRDLTLLSNTPTKGHKFVRLHRSTARAVPLISTTLSPFLVMATKM